MLGILSCTSQLFNVFAYLCIVDIILLEITDLISCVAFIKLRLLSGIFYTDFFANSCCFMRKNVSFALVM